ncbi:hypothetical protein C8Q76DRAFT_473305 [Earliella scabrosa]|nr:hypothetical protein C8Q76DRAFT_473305 [Earliella scabrosa]
MICGPHGHCCDRGRDKQSDAAGAQRRTSTRAICGVPVHVRRRVLFCPDADADADSRRGSDTESVRSTRTTTSHHLQLDLLPCEAGNPAEREKLIASHHLALVRLPFVNCDLTAPGASAHGIPLPRWDGRRRQLYVRQLVPPKLARRRPHHPARCQHHAHPDPPRSRGLLRRSLPPHHQDVQQTGARARLLDAAALCASRDSLTRANSRAHRAPLPGTTSSVSYEVSPK